MKKNILIVVLLVINLIIGFFVAGDYGESWDENNMRSYAKLTVGAYQYFFQPEKMSTYYDSLDDRQYYGPIYLMVGNAFVDFVHTNFNINRDTIYHFYNFLTFQFGVLFFYLLNKRFFSTTTAFANTVLFSFQPVLFGHSFINAKDIAIMVYFMGAIEAGLMLVDAIPPLEKTNDIGDSQTKFSWKHRKRVIRGTLSSEKKNFLKAGILIVLLTGLMSIGVYRNLISWIINIANNMPDSLPGRLFSQIAHNRDSIPLESYIYKGEQIINRANLLLIGLIVVIIVIRFGSKVYREEIDTAFYELRKVIFEKWEAVLKNFRSRETFLYNIRQIGCVFFERIRIWQLWLAACLLGIISSIRLNGPYVAILISLLLLIKNRKKAIPVITLYGITSLIFMYVFWPYLWSNPVGKFVEAITYMTHFPWNETVLFDGVRYKANFVPVNYLPKLLLAQFTETTIITVFFGFTISITQLFKKRINYLAWFLLIFWGLVPLLITIFSHMRIYDNFRHIFFLIPPLLLFGGFAIEFFHQKLKKPLFAFLLIGLVFPGIYSNIIMHPYEYVYYNSTVGGLNGAIGKYELDYLGTSLKEATEYVNRIAPKDSVVYIYAPFHLVSTYARPDLTMTNTMKEKVPGTTGFTVNLNRFYWGNKIFPDDKDLFQVKRGDAVFSTVRSVQ